MLRALHYKNGLSSKSLVVVLSYAAVLLCQRNAVGKTLLISVQNVHWKKLILIGNPSPYIGDIGVLCRYSHSRRDIEKDECRGNQLCQSPLGLVSADSLFDEYAFILAVEDSLFR